MQICICYYISFLIPHNKTYLISMICLHKAGCTSVRNERKPRADLMCWFLSQGDFRSIVCSCMALSQTIVFHLDCKDCRVDSLSSCLQCYHLYYTHCIKKNIYTCRTPNLPIHMCPHNYESLIQRHYVRRVSCRKRGASSLANRIMVSCAPEPDSRLNCMQSSSLMCSSPVSSGCCRRLYEFSSGVWFVLFCCVYFYLINAAYARSGTILLQSATLPSRRSKHNVTCPHSTLACFYMRWVHTTTGLPIAKTMSRDAPTVGGTVDSATGHCAFINTHLQRSNTGTSLAQRPTRLLCGPALSGLFCPPLIPGYAYKQPGQSFW